MGADLGSAICDGEYPVTPGLGRGGARRLLGSSISNTVFTLDCRIRLGTRLGTRRRHLWPYADGFRYSLRELIRLRRDHRYWRAVTVGAKRRRRMSRSAEHRSELQTP